MLSIQGADLDLRSRKCGKQLLSNNNKHDGGGGDDSVSWSDEEQTSKQNTEHSRTTIDNTQRTEMSASDKSHRSSRRESCAEDLDCFSGNGMWRNELKQSDQRLVETEQELPVQPKNKKLSDVVDVLLRVVIVLAFFKLETTPAFKREIHSEELWLYKNPRRPDIVQIGPLLFSAIALPLLLTAIWYAFTRDGRDFRAASWAWTMGLCMTGIPTSLLKITVGRPRPDFFYRCFPDGVMVLNETTCALGNVALDFSCTGRLSDINEGRKSFPSGHASFAFSSFGFIAFYVGAKLHAFDARGRGHTWRLCVALLPLIVASLVAISRTCDYHHHWQDVTVGALIGLFSGYYSYRQYYHSVFSPDAGRPLDRWPRHKPIEAEANDDPKRPLLGKQLTKWY